MFSIGQKVLVTDGLPHREGIIDKVSTWQVEMGWPTRTNTPCYFIRVPEWDNGTNGGRWIDECFVKEISNDTE